jgi:hypothetical protein
MELNKSSLNFIQQKFPELSLKDVAMFSTSQICQKDMIDFFEHKIRFYIACSSGKVTPKNL